MARPKEFDRTEALERAMHVFWRRGFEGSSIQQLLSEMEINRGSLYDTFGDKQSLFLATLKHYREIVMREHLAVLQSENCGLRELRDFLQGLVARALRGESLYGCFAWNSLVELAPHCEKTRDLAEKCVEDVEQCFISILCRSEERGELVSSHSPRELAALLMTFIGGISSCAKSQSSWGKVERSLKVILRLLESSKSH